MYQPQERPPVRPPVRKRRTWPWVLAVAAAAFVGVAAAAGAGERSANTNGNAAAPPPNPAPAEANPANPGPATEFGDGTYLVGTDIAAGSYRASGPRRDDEFGMCYWARQRDDAGLDIIANDLSEGPTRFTAVAGEYVKISGCDFVRA